MSAVTVPLLRQMPYDTEAEWLALRSAYFSASDAATLFGAGGYGRTLADVVAQKVDGEATEETGRMRLGKALEPGIVAMWEAEHGLPVEKPSILYVRGRLAASPDGWVVGTHGRDLLEAKLSFEDCPVLPGHWWWQAQAQMACTGAERVHFAVASPDGPHLDWCVGRDEDAIARLDAAVEGFWAAVDLGMDPEATEAEAGSERVVLGDEEANEVRQWVAAKQVMAEAEAEAKAIRGRIGSAVGVAALAPGSRMTLTDADGEVLARLRVQKGRTSLDRSALAQAVDLSMFEKRGDPMVVWEAAK